MEKSYIRPFPRVVRIESVGICNLRCSHCPTGTVKIERNIMTEETFSLVLSNVKMNIDAVKVVVMYHGGEPLINQRFSVMVKQLKGLGVPFIKTVCNGMLLTEEKIVEIVESGLDEIEISLNGQSSEQNDLIRRGCCYSRVVDNIRNLIKYKKKIVEIDQESIYLQLNL